MNKTLHLISFKIGWAVCLWAASQNYSSLIPWLCGIGLVAINVSVQKKRRLALAKVFTVIFFGFLFEWLNQNLGFYFFPNHNSLLPPLWLLSFWPVFSLLFIEFLDHYANKPLWFHLLIGVVGAADGRHHFCLSQRPPIRHRHEAPLSVDELKRHEF